MDRPPREAEFGLRPARPPDYFFAVTLYLDGAKRHLSKIGRWDRRRLTTRFRRGYKQAQVQVICVEDRRIGWMQVAELVGRLHLHQLHLSADFRRRGIGTRLLKVLLRRADSVGKPVTLEVMHGNPAKRLYARLGFKATGKDADKMQMIWRPRRNDRAPKATRPNLP
jgi:ribosomal protein S18 acetylase RimI-like enzyme